MKTLKLKVHACFFCSVTLLCTVSMQLSADVVLIREGRPMAKIYTDWILVEPTEDELASRQWREENAKSLTQSEVLRDLNYHFRNMSGAELEILRINDLSEIVGPALVLGNPAVQLGAIPRKPSRSKEGFRIISTDDRVLIGGESDEAVIHGLYTLLMQLGCDWLMPGEIGEYIPIKKNVVVPEIDESHAPDFQLRRVWYRGYNKPRLPEEITRFDEWTRRHRGGGNRNPIIGQVEGHVWDQFIRRHKEEFERDPSMLALRRADDGSLHRKGPQLESTHPRVAELFIQDIKEAYQKNIAAGIWTRNTSVGFGIGPADGLGFSESAEAIVAGSGRIDPIVGEKDQTDNLVLLGNRILSSVHEEYPNAHVGFYSYSTHADYPLRYKPNPKIIPIFAPINFSRYHSTLAANSKSRTYLRHVIEQWSQLSEAQGNPMFAYGYNWNLAENMLPYSKVKIWGEELPWYKEKGILGLTLESTKAWGVNGPSDYAYMKLAWDTSLDWQDILEEYCRKSFGKGAKPMEEYLLSIIQAQEEAGQEAGSFHASHLIFNDQWVKNGEALIDTAAEAAETKVEKERVEYFRISLGLLRLYLVYHESSANFDFPQAKASYEAMKLLWQQGYDTNTDIVANEVPYYLRLFLSEFAEQGLKYSSAPYRIVSRIPDDVPTMFDPHNAGDRMNFQSPEINDSQLIKTKTFSATWDAQGLGGIRSGSVWYRHHFFLEKDLQKQAIGLFIGGVEDTVKVWINGKIVGGPIRRFNKPILFDLTKNARYGDTNLLAIQVIRNSKWNEIGLGGIIRPSFVYSGPIRDEGKL